MKMLSPEDIATLVASLTSPREQARQALIAEIREAHAEAVERGDVTDETPPAATFTLAELTERGVRTEDSRGAGIKAGRNGKGEIALAKVIDDDTVLVVLNPASESEDESDAAESDEDSADEAAGE